MRTWTKQTAYEERNRAAGLCARSKRHGQRDPRSRNLCRGCLRRARERKAQGTSQALWLWRLEAEARAPWA